MSNTNAQSVAFVRDTQLPPSAPPPSTVGMLGWLRQNLFSNVWNSALTLLALWAVYYLLSGFMPWLLNGVWGAGSLAECREKLNGEVGGCFSVLVKRGNQLLFGFRYPETEYWRLILSFGLLLVAAAPVLFFKLPRKMLFFTGIYPFLAFWLIYGGPLGTAVFALIGTVVGYMVYTRLIKRSFLTGFVSGVVAALLVWAIGGYIVSALAGEETWLPQVQSRDLGGFMLNMILGTVCVSLSLPLGIVLALGRQSNMPIIKYVCVVFIEFIRGVPLITLLFVANVMLQFFFPADANIDILIRVMIMVTLFSGAYIAEVIRGGLAALPRGQYEAADSLGLDYAQAMQLIILPQALKISIPGIVNVAVGLFKDTTLVSVISMYDLIGMVRGPIVENIEWKGIYWELYAFSALLFFIICYGISQYSQWLERQLATGHR